MSENAKQRSGPDLAAGVAVTDIADGAMLQGHVGEEAVLVVDSGHFPSSARKMIAHLKSVTSKPVKFLVNTHWHQDHVMGNIAFRREWPDVEILAHPFTAKELAKPENGAEYAKNLQQQLPGAIEQVRGILLSGKMPNGNALTETQRENLTEMTTAFAVSVRARNLFRFAVLGFSSSLLELFRHACGGERSSRRGARHASRRRARTPETRNDTLGGGCDLVLGAWTPRATAST